ncbi:MAG: SUMF1/EgtB/PvdO family nonheme iron enzyme [Cyanobacteria bacterium P01_A01_bin.135]
MARYALLIGCSDHGEGLTSLRASLNDVAALACILRDPALGQFDQVTTLLNPEPQALREAAETLFYTARKDDLVLLYFSGHGIKDDRNRLYFSTRLTRKTPEGTLVKSTAVPASFVQDQMTECRSRRQILILDCCFSGAFADGMIAKDDGRVDLPMALGGQGCVILTSTTATQYAFEQSEMALSLYTQQLIKGIATGDADADADGFVAIDELHDYICSQLEAVASPMHPKIYAFDQGFKIHLAKAPAIQTELPAQEAAVTAPLLPPEPSAASAGSAPTASIAASLEPISFTTGWVQPGAVGILGLGDRRTRVQRRSQQAEGFTIELGDTRLTLLRIPAGRFLMGCADTHNADWHPEGPVHRVTLRPFFLSQCLITQAQWSAVATFPKVALDLPLPSRQQPDRPIHQVNWYEAREFCQRLSRQVGWRCRLPSEAEWEYACRAGTRTPFATGEDLPPELANYSSSGPISVGSFPANGFGLYDMHGNLWEWCRDGWHESYDGAPTDGTAWDSPGEPGDRHAARGGSWMDSAETCRSASRIGLAAQTCSSDLGFRIACDL